MVNLPSEVQLTEAELEEVERAIAVYEQHPRGTDPRQINKMMTRMSLAYPNAKLSVEEAGARIELYCDMLADLDSDILAAGFRAAVKTCKFFPSVSEIRGFAMAEPATPRMLEQSRLRALLAMHRASPPKPAEPYATPEQCAAIKAEMGLSAEASAMLDRIAQSKAA